MPIPTVNPNVLGAFVPSTYILDVARLNEIDVNSDEFKELLVRLYQNVNLIALSLNIKTSGYYPLNQFVTGSLYFPAITTTSLVNEEYRQVTRVVINFGALPNAGTKSVPHGIQVLNAKITWVHIYGTATDPIGLTGIPLPYASPTLNKNIELNVDQTNVNVTTAIDYSNYTIASIVLEFLTS